MQARGSPNFLVLRRYFESLIIQLKAMVMINAVHMLVLAFAESVDEILKCDNSNESYIVQRGFQVMTVLFI